MRLASGWLLGLVFAGSGCAGGGAETGTSLDSGTVLVDESCDGVDDDVDGLIDEDGPCERCDGSFSDFAHVGIPGTDEDEDGTVDEGFDSDGNGVADCQEDANAHVRLMHFIIDPTNTDADVDDDGINDAADVDITRGPDADGDGIDDRFDATVLGAPDLDGDGIADAAAGSLSAGLMLPVDISVLGSGVPVNPVPFPTFASTGYTRFPPATYSVQLTAVGQPAAVYYSVPEVSLEGASYYTVLVWGTAVGARGAGPSVIHVVAEDDVSPASAGSMKLRFVNTSFNQAAAGLDLDLWINLASGSPLEDDLPVGGFGEVHELTADGSPVFLDENDDGVPDNYIVLPSATTLAACDPDGIPGSGDEFEDNHSFTVAMADNPFFATLGPPAVGALLVYSEHCPIPKLLRPQTR